MPEKAYVSQKASALSARLAAVQALYQVSQNKQDIKDVCAEYLEHRSGMEVEGEALVAPDPALFEKILQGVDMRHGELETLLTAHLKREEGARDVEPLMKAILLCGVYELLVREFDSPIVINDYLNVAHSFYEKGEVGLINGVLDAVAKTGQMTLK